MTISAGTRLGNYEVVAAIGAGGMGEVYKARDTRLGRDVAVKILPEEFARDADRMRRFDQEARAVAALNHPHVVSVFDSGAQDGIPYLVSELLEGESLRDLLAHGPIPAKKAIDYARQMADGLAAAHAKHIVHRDLKPENLFLTHGGRVKILDFGVAKLMAPDPSGARASGGVSIATKTSAGTVMGTAGYMAPEQVRGDTSVDHRADIFSFGATLYEMLTGTRAFNRPTTVETLHAILKDEPPDIDASQMRVSPALDRIVRHCLEKRPDDRFQSASDLMFALGALTDTSSATRLDQIAPSSTPPVRRAPWAVVAAAAVAGAIVAGAAALLLRPTAVDPGRTEFAIAVSGEVNHVALSADGQWLAYVSPNEFGVPQILVQQIGAAAPKALAGTEGASYPFWSPDNAFVGFFSNGHLRKLAMDGTGVQPLAPIGDGARGGSWGSKGVIIYAPDAGGPLWRVNADGSGAAALTTAVLDGDESTHRWPWFLPDGDHFLMFGGNLLIGDSHNAVYLSSLSNGGKAALTPARSGGAIAEGRLYFSDDAGVLFSIAVDVAAQKTTGSPEVVATRVAHSPSTYYAAFTVSSTSTLVYNGDTVANRSQLTWFDPSGKELGRIGPIGVLANPSISPDGTRVAFDSNDFKAKNVDVWLLDLNNALSRFTFGPSEEVVPKWTRDGSMISYRTFGLANQASKLQVKKVSGLEPEHTLPNTMANTWDILPNDWTADGGAVLANVQATGSTTLSLQLRADGAISTVVKSTGAVSNGQISPDGQWLAYASNESGDWEIYVTTFPGAAGKWQVSRGGGTEPKWRRDGKALFYIAARQMLTEATINTEGTFSVGALAERFRIRSRAAISSTDLFTYDVAADGKRFLVNQYLKPEQAPPLALVLHGDQSAARSK